MCAEERDTGITQCPQYKPSQRKRAVEKGEAVKIEILEMRKRKTEYRRCGRGRAREKQK